MSFFPNRKPIDLLPGFPSLESFAAAGFFGDCLLEKLPFAGLVFTIALLRCLIW